MAKIAIIGLSGGSLFMRVDKMPLLSTTIVAKDMHIEAGGKGYNQAMAASKMGQSVSYLSKIGNDYYGNYVKTYMEKTGIKTYFLQPPLATTAIATILINQNGENEVIVYQGKNTTLNIEDLEIFKEEIKKADVLLLQYEISLDVIKKAIDIAKANDTFVILNPAPAIYLDKTFYQNVDILTPNLEEARLLFDIPANFSIEKIGRYLSEITTNTIIVTLGSKGCLLVQKNSYRLFKAYHVNSVDTTGAGDIFNAALAKKISAKSSYEDAISYAMAASAISVTKPYVMDAIPSDEEISAFLKLYNLKQKN